MDRLVQEEKRCFLKLNDKIFKQEDLIKLVNEPGLDEEFLKWTKDAVQFLICMNPLDEVEVEMDVKDQQWVVVIKTARILILRINNIDNDTILEELKGKHSKT